MEAKKAGVEITFHTRCRPQKLFRCDVDQLANLLHAPLIAALTVIFTQFNWVDRFQMKIITLTQYDFASL
jgi:hypothetical protein